MRCRMPDTVFVRTNKIRKNRKLDKNNKGKWGLFLLEANQNNRTARTGVFIGIQLRFNDCF